MRGDEIAVAIAALDGVFKLAYDGTAWELDQRANRGHARWVTTGPAGDALSARRGMMDADGAFEARPAA